MNGSLEFSDLNALQITCVISCEVPEESAAIQLFEITAGEFEFDTNRDKISAIEKHDLPMMDMMGLAIEVARCRDEWRYIHETISDLDTVFIKKPGHEDVKDSVAVEILKCINGRRTVRNISDRASTSRAR